MTPDSIVALIASLFAAAMAIATVLRRRFSVARWCFIVGLIVLAIECVSVAVSLSSSGTADIIRWQKFAFAARCILPCVWLCFSVTYSRGNYLEFLGEWRLILVASFVVPIGILAGFHAGLIHIFAVSGAAGEWVIQSSRQARALDGILLVANVFILKNLEKTFRSAVGIMRWRIKFVVLGLVVIFGTRIYTLSQMMLYSTVDLSLTAIDSIALIVGCALILLAYLRSGFAEIDVYPSQAVIETSLTVLAAGAYLFIVGVFAQFVGLLGWSNSFQSRAFIILVGIVVLAVSLLSDRFRQRMRYFASLHFKRPQQDFRKVWTSFTQQMSSVLDQRGLCAACARLISETFDSLSVTILLIDKRKENLVWAASTSELPGDSDSASYVTEASEVMISGLVEKGRPLNLDTAPEEWAKALRLAIPPRFRKGGSRIGVPLIAGERLVGVALLADRVNGIPYTEEETDLLNCIGDQAAVALLNIQLTDDLVAAKEMEAFQTMSAFFVHDLKNAVSSLSLMLKNLPVHFDDPEFRQDALRGIGGTVNRINQMISRLSVLRNKLELNLVETDLAQLVTETLKGLNGSPGVEWITQFDPVPKIAADREQLQTVINNLLINARDAVGTGGRVRVEVGPAENNALLTVADNGCGMSSAFLSRSLFRPFHTTKKNGLGIGMFQSKKIIEAHGGDIHVESEPGKGTTFRLRVPLGSERR